MRALAVRCRRKRCNRLRQRVADGHRVAACALQRQRQPDASILGGNIMAAGGGGQVACAQHLGRRVPGQVPGCAHAMELGLAHYDMVPMYMSSAGHTQFAQKTYQPGKGAG